MLSGCAKSLEYIQCRIAPIHIFRVEVALHKLTCLFFYPGLNFVSTKEQIYSLRNFGLKMLTTLIEDSLLCFGVYTPLEEQEGDLDNTLMEKYVNLVLLTLANCTCCLKLSPWELPLPGHSPPQFERALSWHCWFGHPVCPMSWD